VTSSENASGAEPNTATATIARATSELLRAVNASDVAGVLAVWSEDGVLMPPHHPSVHGRPAIERYFRELFARTRFIFTFTSCHVHVSGDTAFARVEYVVSARPTHGGSEVRDVGKGLHVYRRQPNGAWQLAIDVWNSDIPVAGA
jgi:uncharacterized protein (TIGR02246 family)